MLSRSFICCLDEKYHQVRSTGTCCILQLCQKSKVRTERGHFPCLPLQGWRQTKCWILVPCGALTKTHQRKDLCTAVLRGGWEEDLRPPAGTRLWKKCGRRPTVRCWREPDLREEGLLQTDSENQHPRGQCSEQLGKRVASAGSLMSSLWPDAALPKGFPKL